MTDPEKWKDLCEKAAVEQDPKRLLRLVQQINDLFEKQRIDRKRQEERQSQ